MIECVTKIDGKVQKYILKNKLLTSFIFFIVGLVGSVVYIVLSTIFFEVDWLDFLIIVFVPILVGSALAYIMYRNIVNKASKNVFANLYAFYDEEILVKTIDKDANVHSEAKISYKNLLKVKEDNKYLLIYINKNSVWPIDKTRLSQEQIEKLKSIFKKFNLIK